MSTYIAIIIAAVLTNNFVLSKFYGCCPFLGVSKKLDSSVGMGAAVVFVMLCASLWENSPKQLSVIHCILKKEISVTGIH